ncbi:DUF6470 family protein [Alkalibacillus aidingensis]|uniref:DUF6470 family protein n=1 Tax=Alkalibacillus aidingensis TaxID=2747607 RepID=UPI001660CFCF|nr:DUF6470 family protein [Alkalibacillus aidingensis]
MQLPPIQYHIQQGRIGIQTHDAEQQITQREADLQISQPEADIEINRTPPKLSIDQSQAWRDMGISGPLESTKENADEGKQTALEGVARRAREGNEMARIEHGDGAVERIAKRNMPNEYRGFTMGWIPSSYFAVDIEYDPGDVDVNVQKNDPIIEATPNKPVMNYQPGNVDVYMEQHPDFEMDVDMATWRAQNFDIHV